MKKKEGKKQIKKDPSKDILRDLIVEQEEFDRLLMNMSLKKESKENNKKK